MYIFLYVFLRSRPSEPGWLAHLNIDFEGTSREEVARWLFLFNSQHHVHRHHQCYDRHHLCHYGMFVLVKGKDVFKLPVNHNASLALFVCCLTLCRNLNNISQVSGI